MVALRCKLLSGSTNGEPVQGQCQDSAQNERRSAGDVSHAHFTQPCSAKALKSTAAAALRWMVVVIAPGAFCFLASKVLVVLLLALLLFLSQKRQLVWLDHILPVA